ncbi:hypothetical protein JB92DRAFT_3115449 [Gautieria morchelliformis]|nr:hypothetical protein JB92DRAFT_3115449 [Gautieria morchelliformis]
MFLSSDDDGENAPTPKKARTEPGPQQHLLELVWSPLVEVLPTEPPPAPHQKGRTNAQVAEADKILQLVVMQEYPEHVFLLGWKIFIGGCVSPEEYEAKEEKDAWEAEVKEWGTKVKIKGKVKDTGSIAGTLSISLGVSLTSMLVAKERVEELVERLEDSMRNVLVKLNVLNGSVLELEGVQKHFLGFYKVLSLRFLRIIFVKFGEFVS